MTVDTDLFGAALPVRRAMGSHQSASGGSDEWLTPKHILDALGPFDLDPCAPITRPWPTAARHLTIEDDGLAHPWEGRVWCNPPYARLRRWIAKLMLHRNGTALIFARTETRTWQDIVWPQSSGILFLAGRVRFATIDGKPAPFTSGAPSALVAFGARDAEILEACVLDGRFVQGAAS